MKDYDPWRQSWPPGHKLIQQDTGCNITIFFAHFCVVIMEGRKGMKRLRWGANHQTSLPLLQRNQPWVHMHWVIAAVILCTDIYWATCCVLGTLQDAVGMEVKVPPDFTEIPSTDLVINPLIQSSITGCQLVPSAALGSQIRKRAKVWFWKQNPSFITKKTWVTFFFKASHCLSGKWILKQFLPRG